MGELTQGEIYEALGVTPTAEDNSGGEEQEIAEPAPGNDSAADEADGKTAEDEIGEKGGEEQDVAEPAPEGDDAVNAAAAAARRRAEAEANAKIEKAVAEAKRQAEADSQKKLEEMIAVSNIVDPETGEEIKTLEDYRKMQQREAAGKDPAAAKAIDEANAAKSEADAEKEKYTLLEGNKRLEDGLAEIQKLDPDIKSLDDVFASENHEKIYDLVMKGVPLADAYKAANIGKITEKIQAAEAQRARNAINSKSHLKGDGGSDKKPLAEVPRETLDYYHELFPSMSDAEIQKDYNKRMKG